MSIIYWMLRVTPTQARAMRDDGSLPARFSEVALERHYRKGDVGAEDGHDDRTSDALGGVGPAAKVLCLEKSWSIMQYLFAQQQEAATKDEDLLFLGEGTGDAIGGYGPGWIMNATLVAHLSQYLDTIDVQELIRGIDYRDMQNKQVYGMMASGGLSDQSIERELQQEVVLFLPRLRDYVRESATNGCELLCWLG